MHDCIIPLAKLFTKPDWMYIGAQYSSLSSFDSVPLVIISWSLGFQILKIKLYDMIV